jgi:hypothetical protein
VKPPQTARAAAVVDGLLAAIGAVKDASTALLDGAYPGDLAESDGIAVGVGDESVLVTREREPGYGDSYRETVTVVCLAWSWTGNTDMAPRRARCAELITLVQEAVATDRRLGGSCDQADLDGNQSWLQTQTDGATCAVGFSVSANVTGA